MYVSGSEKRRGKREAEKGKYGKSAGGWSLGQLLGCDILVTDLQIFGTIRGVMARYASHFTVEKLLNGGAKWAY